MGVTRGTAVAGAPLVTAALVILGTSFASDRAAAQWLNNPTPGVPRTADGKVDVTAPAPRMVNGKPDLSGLWMTAETDRPPRAGATAATWDEPRAPV